MTTFFQIRILLLACCMAMLLPANGQKKKKAETDFRAMEVRAYMDAFYAQFSGFVEEAADSIKRSTDDDEIKAATLLWKMNAIPAAQRSIFTTNPLEALIDANVLCVQMDHFFKDGKGKTIFGEQQTVAIATSRFLRENATELLIRFLDGTFEKNAIEQIQFFALNYPIQSIYFNRASTKPLIASMFGEESGKFKEVAQDMNQSIKDLNNRINFITDQLPKQIRWQSEYLMYDVTPENVKALENIPLDTMMWQLDSLTSLAYTMPGLVDEQRDLFFEYLTKERELITELLQAERDLAFDLMQSERALILKELTKQRERVFEESNGLIDETINETFTLSKDLVEYVVWRVVLILVGIFIGLVILVVLYRKL